MEQVNEASVVLKPAFRAIGLRWEGTFEEAGAGAIRVIQEQMHKRLHEITNVVNSQKLLGLSYHAHPGGSGFVHYAAVEVPQIANIAQGMIDIHVPASSYAKCEHRKGQSIDRTYQNMYAWIKQHGYSESKGDLTHFEQYPMHQDPYDKDPEFIVLIPIEG